MLSSKVEHNSSVDRSIDSDFDFNVFTECGPINRATFWGVGWNLGNDLGGNTTIFGSTAM